VGGIADAIPEGDLLGDDILIFVSVGSQKFQMDRLLLELDRLCETASIRQEVVAQTGYCRYHPVHFKSQPFYSKEEIDKIILDCDLLICHSGTGTILTGLRNGKPVIVIPRQARYGEHVDDHQRDIAAAFEEKGLILVAWEAEQILAKVEAAESWKPQSYQSNTEYFVGKLREQILKMETEKSDNRGKR